MPSEAMMLYKLILLYILNRVDFPLTNNQLTEFILGKEYTNYFNVQQSISQLIDDDYIVMETIRNNSLYRITDSGKQTLSFFQNEISAGICKDIDEYLNRNEYQLREDVANPADYEKQKTGDYLTRLQVIERGTTLFEIKLSVSSEEEAIRICNDWKNVNADLYRCVMTKLMTPQDPSDSAAPSQGPSQDPDPDTTQS